MRAWLTLLLASLGACAANQPLHFSSAPPGAQILIDGQDTGFVTPALLDVDNPNGREVALVLSGYETAVRTLVDERQGELVMWNDATVDAQSWRFPLFLPYQDFFFFYKMPGSPRLENQIRGRIFVRLRRSNDR